MTPEFWLYLSWLGVTGLLALAGILMLTHEDTTEYEPQFNPQFDLNLMAEVKRKMHAMNETELWEGQGYGGTGRDYSGKWPRTRLIAHAIEE